MSTVRRTLLGGLWIAICAGFVPVGSCAKGCGACARSSDDVARTARYSDDFAHAVPRSSVGTHVPVPVPLGGRGALLGEEAVLASRSLDDAVMAMPEVEGTISSIARAPSKNGASLVIDDAGRSFGGDYARSIEKVGVSKPQHEKLMDAFDHAQEIVGQVVELAGDDDDEQAKAQAKVRESLRRQTATLQLERDLAVVLTAEQRTKLYALLGSPELIVHRLAKEQPIVRADKR